MPENNRAAKFNRLIEIVAALRAPDGCPWDREQTPRTIAPYLLEETHEVLEAIETGDDEGLREELGDLMLEVALLAQMAGEEDKFEIGDCLDAINEKLVRRHPHVFGETAGKKIDADEVNRRWSEIKKSEKPKRSALGGVPRTLPALHRARRVSEKAAGVGFDWPEAISVLDKVEEEIGELRQALSAHDRAHSEEELGDLFFALVNLARHLGLDPERSLNFTTDKFMARFAHIESALEREGKELAKTDLEELERLWVEAKGAKQG